MKITFTSKEVPRKKWAFYTLPVSGFEPISAPCGQKVIKLTFPELAGLTASAVLPALAGLPTPAGLPARQKCVYYNRKKLSSDWSFWGAKKGKKRSPPAYHVGFTQYASGLVFRGYSPPVILKAPEGRSPRSRLWCVRYTGLRPVYSGCQEMSRWWFMP